MKKILIIISLLFLSITTTIYGQNQKPWHISANGGVTLYWGDLSDNVSNPLSKYFSNEREFGGGLSFGRDIYPFLSVNGQFFIGKLSGIREKWSDGSTANLYFNTDFMEINIHGSLDFIGLFSRRNELKRFGVYGMAGFGTVFYRAIERDLITDAHINSVGYSSNGLVKDNMAQGWVIPVGGGVVFRPRTSWTINLETSYRFVLNDEIDAQHTVSSKSNDIYLLSTLGVTYKFGTKKRKKPTPIYKKQEATTVKKEEWKITVASILPDTVKVGDVFYHKIAIQKAGYSDLGKLKQRLPEGFTAEAVSMAGGTFDFSNQEVTVSWDKTPINSSLVVNYKIIADNPNSGTHKLNGSFNYQENSENKTSEFNNVIYVLAPAVTPEVKAEEPAATPWLEYRVQIKAVSGGKVPIAPFAKAHNITLPIKESFHNGYIKYSIGSFDNYQSARELRDNVRTKNRIPDAFVVAFVNGQQLNSLSEIPKETPDVTQPVEVKSDLSSSKTYEYRVQIGSYSPGATNKSKLAAMYGIRETIREEYHDGYVKYTVGSFTNINDAYALRDKLQNKNNVKDAFVATYLQGKRLK